MQSIPKWCFSERQRISSSGRAETRRSTAGRRPSQFVLYVFQTTTTTTSTAVVPRGSVCLQKLRTIANDSISMTLYEFNRHDYITYEPH